MMHIAFSCDGTRNDMDCRGALHTRTANEDEAVAEAYRKGWWMSASEDGVTWLCHSSGHNEVKG